MRELRFVLRRASRWKGLMILAVALTVVQCGMELWLPRLMAEAVNSGILEGSMETIRSIGRQMLLVCAVMGISGYGSSVICAAVGQRLALGLRGELYDKISSLSVRQVSAIGHGSLLTRLTADIDTCAEFVHSLLLLAAEPVLLTVGGIYMMWRLAPPLGTAFLGFVLVLFCVMLLFIRATAPGFRRVRAVTDRLNARMQRVFGSFRLIKSYNTRTREQDAFSKDNTLLFDTAFAVQKRIAFFNPIIMLIVDLTVAVILLLSGRQVASASMDVGSVLSAITWSEQILLSIAAAGGMFRIVAETQPSAQRVREVLETESDMPDGSESIAEPFRELRFEDVSFGYEADVPVVDHLNFALHAGETLAVVGPVGCGKTTLASLCARLYDVTGGRVTLNGADIKTLRLEELRRAVALVEKQSAVLEGTVLENIVFGRKDIGREDVARAVSAAQLEEYIEKAPKGLDTPLAAMGRSLSGGERQRLTIARALAGRPGLLVLDDSTSSLDYRTERQLLEGVKEHYAGSAVLLITNRLMTATRADRILVLDGSGRIAAEGTDAALRRRCALYRRMAEQQAREE